MTIKVQASVFYTSTAAVVVRDFGKNNVVLRLGNEVTMFFDSLLDVTAFALKVQEASSLAQALDQVTTVVRQDDEDEEDGG